jgi:hypothetical protein
MDNEKRRNRSSAFSPEELGEINMAIQSACQEVARGFAKHAPTSSLSDEQFEILQATIRNAVTDGIVRSVAVR